MAATGETNLDSLLQTMNPVLDSDRTYVFGTIQAETPADTEATVKRFASLPGLQMLFREEESWTVILSEDVAKESQLEYSFPCKKITLNVHSSLEAVGFLAAITTRVKELGVGVNPVSAYFHDHLFVPFGKEQQVMEALENLSKGR